MPHAFGRFIQQELDARGWKQADLVSRSGLSRALISKYTSDDREVLQRKPGEATVRGIAKGFSIPEQVVWRAVARAMGLDVGEIPSVVHEVGTASDSDLLGELARRLNQRPISDEAYQALRGEEEAERAGLVESDPGPAYSLKSENPHPKDSIAYRRFEEARGRAAFLLERMVEVWEQDGNQFPSRPVDAYWFDGSSHPQITWADDPLSVIGTESGQVVSPFGAVRKTSGVPPLPADVAANDPGVPSRGEQLRDAQDRDAERDS